MAEQCYLGIDLGASSGRVMAGLFDGQKMRLQELHRFENGGISVGGTLRWNVIGLWSEIQKGLAKAATEFGDSVVSIGIDTWGVDYVLLSQSSEILGFPYTYRDARTSGMMKHTFTQVPQATVFAETGVQFMELNTLYQLVAMRQNTPELLDAADLFLMMPDYFNWLLSGSRVVEYTNATTTQCFHPVQKDWSESLLKQLEIPTDMFPEVVAPGTHLGTLRDEVARNTGLGKVNVVAPATHDTGSAVAAVPTEKTGQANWAYISSGTWSLMGLEINEAIVSPQAMELNLTNEGGVDGTFRLLKNIAGLWLVQECRRSFERNGESFDYGKLTQLAAEAAPFRSIIDPDDATFVSPDDMPAAIRDFCRNTNQPEPESEGQFVRCALEALTLKYRKVLSTLESLTGTPVEVIHIVGGGTQNELLNQFTANACGRPVVTGPVEATVLGNLLLQARTAGEIGSLADVRGSVRASSEMKRFEPEASSEWQAANQRFDELLARPR
ncbi:MAG: rhamnulokinase [Planctomycetaceae bacterium]|nr:rhamnulokinase [Planctomycetaceae bacterium]